MKRKTQTVAVFEVMEKNGGYMHLKDLYKEALKVENVEWKSKTPDASIRRIVQDDKYFFKVKPGLWALNSYLSILPNHIKMLYSDIGSKENGDANHSYYQGVLVELGNIIKQKTYIPKQDKNKKYVNKKLDDISTIKELPNFTYETIIKKIKSIDVVWLDNISEQIFPSNVFEVENSTNFDRSFLKFNELRKFQIQMVVVAPNYKRSQFENELLWDAYRDLKGRVSFFSYDDLDNFWDKMLNNGNVGLFKELVL